MYQYQFHDVSKIYKVDKEVDFYALKNISLTLQGPGFVSIIGKSGSGKSTILNLLAGLDKATLGSVTYLGHDISRMKERKKSNYYKKDISILFQNYNLLPRESALFNVLLPMYINGERKSKAKARAESLLLQVGLSKVLFDKKVSLLSGGEQQRVALARCLANEPKILLCDEPTGALDFANSEAVMKTLKEYSRFHLVVLVSHNLQLVKEYSDRIIEIAGGKIITDHGISSPKTFKREENNKCSKSDRWISKLITSNFTHSFKRNLFSILALSISIIFAFLSIGFINGKDDSLRVAALKQFDFGVGTISKEEKISESSLLSLSRSTRPNYQELLNAKEIQQNFKICGNFDALLSVKPNIKYDETLLENCYFYPVYSFDKNYVDHSLLSQGVMGEDSLKNVVVNRVAYEEIKRVIKKEPLNEYIQISAHETFNYIDFDETYVLDEFHFSKKMRICGVVDELSYLSTPKIYYSYTAFEEYLSNLIMPNLSTYFDYDITWLDRVMDAENYNIITSYSYRLFPNSVSNYDKIFDGVETERFSYSSPSLLIKDSLMNFMKVAEYGLLLFLVVALVGAILILGIISFTNYSENHKTSAILTCLGARTGEISDIYLNENLFVTIIALVISLGTAFLLEKIINPLIFKWTGLTDLLVIPFKSFLGVPLLFPILGILFCVLVSMVVTMFPILFSKKIQLKEELQSL